MTAPSKTQTLSPLALLEDTFTGIDFGIALMDEDLNFVLFNEKYAELAFGDGIVPKIGDNAAALSVRQLETGLYILPEGLDPAAMSEAMVAAVKSCQSEIPLERRDGRHLMASAKRTALGGYLVSVTDVTDSKRAADADEARWRAVNDVVGSLQEGFSLWDSDMRFLMCNDQYLRDVLPYRDTPPAVGTPGSDVIRESYRTGHNVLPEGMTEDAFVAYYMDWAQTHAGAVEARYADGRIIVVTSQKTDLGGVLITTQDVTEERNSELKAREMVYDAMESLEEGFALWDSEMGFLMCNQKYVDLVIPFRDRPFEVGASVADSAREVIRAGLVVFPEDLSEDEIIAGIEHWVRTFGPPQEYYYKDGRVVSLTVKPTKLGAFLVTAVDITDSKRAADAEEARARAINDLVGSLDEGVALWDHDMRFLMCNDQYMKDSLPFRSAPPPVGTRGEDLIKEAYHGGLNVIPDGMTEQEFVQLWMDWAWSHAGPMEGQFVDGRTVVLTSKATDLGGLLITTKDVTEERNSEVKAREMVYDAMESLEEGFALWDSDMRFLMCNQRHLDIVVPYRDTPWERGLPAEQTMREAYRSGIYVLPENQTEEEYLAEVGAWAQNFGVPKEFPFKDGRTVVITPHRTDLGGFLLTSLDVTEERNSEAKARDMLLDAFQALDEGLVLCDENMNYVFGNDAWKKMMFEGFEQNIPQVGDSVIDNLIHHVKRGFYAIPEGMTEDDYIDWIMGEMAEHGKNVRYASASGRHFNGSSHRTAFGGSLLFVRDITKQQYAEEQRLNAITDAVQTLSNGIVLYDADMNYVMSNDLHDDFWFKGAGIDVAKQGESLRSVIGRLLDADYMLLPEGLSKEDYFDALLAATETFQKGVMLHSKGGTISANVIQTGLGGYLIEMTDVTEQRLAEENRLAAVNDALDAVDDPLALFSSGRRFVLGNKAWLDMVKGRGEPQPDDTADTLFLRLLENNFYKVPEGMSDEEFLQLGLRAMDDLVTDYPLSLTDGTEQLANVRKTGLDGFLISYRNVTEQLAMEAELEQQRETAHQSEKLSALGELLAGVAHELNNPLSVVFGYSQMLQDKIDDPVLSERVDMICQSSERAAKIVRTFLAMARQRPTELEPCSINDIVETALEISSYSMKSNGTQVNVELDSSDPYVSGDFDQLAQVFSNLIVNAGHAVGDQGAAGQITLASRVTAGQVQVEIRDNGHGIPEDILGRIFEPFFTTKDFGEGTGIGLAFSHRIVDSHGGTLTVKSKVGQGTQFFVRLDTVARADLAVAGTAPATGGGQSVLVVDDEEGVAQLITDMLTEEGYRVTKMTDPTAALRLAEADRFDTILSDFKMPQMNGETFYRALEAVAPENARRMGFITGDAMSAQVLGFLRASGRPHIEKPIMRAELLALIERASAGRA